MLSILAYFFISLPGRWASALRCGGELRPNAYALPFPPFTLSHDPIPSPPSPCQVRRLCSNLETLMFPYCPPHRKEMKLFVVPHTEQQYFGVPKNLKLPFQLTGCTILLTGQAVPLLELYDNVQVRGMDGWMDRIVTCRFTCEESQAAGGASVGAI
ncbi:unnamed protein product [Closterium sp. Naga37s-1]|nr:unnamed protein product [Closterium sp. Naga37s-1]